MIRRFDLDVFSGVKLEGWLSAKDFQVKISAGVGEADLFLKIQIPSVDRYIELRRINDKAMIDMRFCGTQNKRFVRFYSGKVSDSPRGYVGIVHLEILGSG